MAYVTRRTLVKAVTSGTAAALASSSVSARGFFAPSKLAPSTFELLPLGAVRPTGWLRRQLQIQADGMTGHLDEFWPDVGPNSGWLGGTGESWERGPYFLDGLLPLGYLLDDVRLKSKAQKFIEWTLQSQRPDGMFGPSKNDDWWPRMVMLKALAQHYEVTQDPRVLPFMGRYFRYQLAAMPERPLKSWGKYRWQDEAYVVEWLYERRPDPELLRLATLMQTQGYDWKAQFADFQLTAPTSSNFRKKGQLDDALRAHGVNQSQALKVAAVQYKISGDRGERAAFARQQGALDTFHGMPNGMFSCDEHLAGLEPQHGTELCSVVETMFSLEVILATFGEVAVADRLEKIAYNALPGTFTDDMWAHQYDQQSNQVQVGLLTKPWTTNGPESNLYGLAPHFGCCTANYHQGWPKFTSSLWMRAPNEGLVAAIYAPCEVTTEVRSTRVRVVEETEYPFRGSIRFAVNPARPVSFPLCLRVPHWAEGAKVSVNGRAADVPVTPGTFARIERQWKQGDTVELTLPLKPRISRWFNRSVAVERGPLVFSFDPGEEWVKLRDRGPTADWQVFPQAPWNYALDVHEASAAEIQVTEGPVGARPFAKDGTPVQLHVSARRLDTWRSEDGVATAPPMSPAGTENPPETITLIPYASAKLRVTAFPSLRS